MKYYTGAESAASSGGAVVALMGSSLLQELEKITNEMMLHLCLRGSSLSGRRDLRNQVPHDYDVWPFNIPIGIFDVKP